MFLLFACVFILITSKVLGVWRFSCVCAMTQSLAYVIFAKFRGNSYLQLVRFGRFLKKLLSQFDIKFMKLWHFLKTKHLANSSRLYLSIQKAKAVAQRYSVEKVFLEISQNSQQNTCARVSFQLY